VVKGVKMAEQKKEQGSKIKVGPKKLVIKVRRR